MNLQNGGVWTPATPDKPVETPDQAALPVEMQQSEKGGDEWDELLGIYSGVLQDQNCGELPPECSLSSLLDLNQMESATRGFPLVPPAPQMVQNVAFAEAYDTLLPWDVETVDMWRGFNQNATSYVVPHQKVDSMAELMGIKSALTMNGGGITWDEATAIGSYSQIERSWNAGGTDGMMHQQKQILNGDQDVGGHNLQQMPTSRLSVAYRPSYNLNLPPTMEAGESSSSVSRPRELEPVPHLAIDEISTKEKSKQDNAVQPQQAEIGEREHTNFLHGSPGASSALTSTPPQEKQISDERNAEEIDLNKTPFQKTPKRRKHRPKVVKEGKPKRTPKPKATANNTAGESSTTKRKYVRKKGIKTSTDQSSDSTNGVEASNVENKKSCKRVLNFDLENGGKKIKGRKFDHQADSVEGSKSNSNLDFHNAELNGPSTSTVNVLHRKQKEILPQESLPVAATDAPAASKDRTLNVIARSLSMRNANINQSGSQTTNGQVHHIDGGLAQILANTSRQNLDGKWQPELQNGRQLLEDSVDVSKKQGSKREHSQTELTQHQMFSQIWSHGASEKGNYNRERKIFWKNSLESSRTKNDKMIGCSSSMRSSNTTANDCSEQIKSTGNKSFHAESSKLHLRGGLPHFSGEGKSIFIDLTDETNIVTQEWCMNSTDSGHKFQKQVKSYAQQTVEMASNHFAKTQTTANCNMVFASQRDSQVTKGNKTSYAPARVSTKRQAARQTPSSIVSNNLQGLGHMSKKVAGSREYNRTIYFIDDIINRMKHLRISTNNGKEVIEEEQNALVPYRGDGAVVPFEVFDPIQKRRPRPKVDLDPETNRLWNVLMGNEASENAKTVNDDKQKFWEEERKVFRGRVDSFIARMHLVQGDRRFSKWKGSVVDSVIGVFLTQNVSDHLSSSAFMYLAAKFPAKSTTTRETCCQSRRNPTEHEVIISFPDEGTSCHHPLTSVPVIDHSSVIASQLSQYKAETSGENVSVSNPTRRKEEDVTSSQSSSEYVTFQATEDIRSSSGSNSEAEDQVTGSSFRNNHAPLNLNLCEQAERNLYQVQETGSPFPDNEPSELLHGQNPGMASDSNAYFYPFTSSELHYQSPISPSTNYWQKLLVGLDEKETDLLEFLGKECTSSLTSTHSDTTNATSIEHAHDIAGQNAESSLTDQQTGSSKFVNHEFLNKHLEQQMNLPTESQSRNSQHFVNYSQRGTGKTSQRESSFLTNPTKSAESFKQKPRGNQNPSENITLEPTEMKTSHVSDVQSSKISRDSNVKKRKAEKEKEEPFNWDTLREQVHSKAETKGRSKNTLDSLDYEALLNATVHEISQTIKERGMNNMLAARMKDFLNRLVKDHGSVDLEWLRDVQPDKVKDYLLSIRGLGLKSVECVRLLTLHHLAFPVDTNVGRIAVRLGWVPLQPLPETLQLHLLELYPVLETIQKYLWPRLCMLDQETLYELHYQLITFGKVFCTKRQPNCNACPMRGECRHFASAFASARLALPGPEERRVVRSDVPSSSSKSCGVAIHPMALPPAGDNAGRGPAIIGNCEPIIEEPTTPEYIIEESERDIEDAFYEDPDEIPEIKLNIEEFTTNLQSFIQDKMEMQEGDMSKALVALSPGFASIPTPKLKHVSRLRTEHRVYELPDSHPLLKGLDRREPDDPSPYLLAIWAPGETADSILPPVSECSSSRGGLCNMKTCFSCNSAREDQSQTVRGTILIPCRTAMRGSFPLNGTYFQVNEVFADDETSMNPIDVPRSLIWNLPRRTVFFGTSVSTIFKGMSTEDIQYCFWKGFVCVRGFNQKTRAPRPLKARLHLVASKMAKKNE
ncbi:hypothetical protein ACS0TY_009484 [Phlomoides rotata]